MKSICKKCNRKFAPLYDNHIYNGRESIIYGNESIFNGSEYKKIKEIYNYKCPYCSIYYNSGYLIKEK